MLMKLRYVLLSHTIAPTSKHPFVLSALIVIYDLFAVTAMAAVCPVLVLRVLGESPAKDFFWVSICRES